MNTVPTVIGLFGTRPEIIKMSPVFAALQQQAKINLVLVSSGQQADLIPTYLGDLGLGIAHHLNVMRPGQSLNQLLARLLESLDGVFDTWPANGLPNGLMVQGDTTTALAGALSASQRNIPVMHIEAGLRTGDITSPFPEETNRRLITQLAALHFAPTQTNVQQLQHEGIGEDKIILSGNPIVDAVQSIVNQGKKSPACEKLLAGLTGKKLIVMTMHRRENFGDRMTQYFETVKQFIETQPDTALVLPVHPNPQAQNTAQQIFTNVDRVQMIEPLNYADFIHLLGKAWLVLSDSGGIQEEVATLGVPLFVLRHLTERPEAIKNGSARLAPTPASLHQALQDVVLPNSWINQIKKQTNPFGAGNSGPVIAGAITAFLNQHRHGTTH